MGDTSINKGLQVSIRSESNVTYTACTEDLSPAGFFIKTQQVFPHGTILEISIKGSNGPIVTLCRVVWARKAPSSLFHQASTNGMGVLIMEFKKGEAEYHKIHRKTNKITEPCNDIYTPQNSPLYSTGAA